MRVEPFDFMSGPPRILDQTQFGVGDQSSVQGHVNEATYYMIQLKRTIGMLQ